MTIDRDSVWVCSECGYDYCVCHYLGIGMAGSAPKVRARDLRPEIKRLHLRTVVSTMIRGQAPDDEIAAMQAKLDALSHDATPPDVPK